MKGIVSKSTGSWYKILIDGVEVNARLRGKIRTKDLKSTNPVTIGDHVIIEHENDEYLIADIEDRKNCIVRKSNKLSKQYQVIAANIDLALLMITPGQPFTPQGFIDRYLVAAESFNIPVTILLNKSDLSKKKIDIYREELYEIYSTIGYPCHKISLVNQDNIQFIREHIKGKTVLISGNSGVGKSTLINMLEPSLGQKTGVISTSYHKGKHTTTFAQMFALDSSTFIIDTPGIKDFGLVSMEKTQLSHYFPEMKVLLPECKFSNCIHVEEPECAVVEALENGTLFPTRYLSYLSMLEEIDNTENY